MNHSNAVFKSILWSGKAYFLSFQEDISLVFLVSAEKIRATRTDASTYLDENGNVTESETGTKVTYTNEDFAAKVKVVVNKSGKLLPGTGGTGEMIFTVSGVLIAIVAGVVLLNTKRRKRVV